MSKRICVFGDSITWGSKDLEFGGWVERLKVWFMNMGKYRHVFNLAISGKTTKDILQRIENELVARVSPTINKKGILTIIATPINDSRFTKDKFNKDVFEISLEQFKKNLNKLNTVSAENSGKLIFIEMTKIDEPKTVFINEEWGVYYNNEIIKKYNKILKEFCKKENIHFIEMFDLLEDEDLPDGLHPNAEGHRKMFERIRNYLVENKIVE